MNAIQGRSVETVHNVHNLLFQTGYASAELEKEIIMSSERTTTTTNRNSSMTETQTLQIDVWSDIVCPFCYIGKRHLEDALKRTGLGDSVDIVWHSFELAPEAETNTEANIYEELASRKGWSVEQSKQIHDQMEERAKQAGLDFHFDRTIPANSFRAHRLLHLAKRHGCQDEIKENLLKAYFTDGKNIDDESVLIRTGIYHGLKEAEIRDALTSETIAEEIQSDIQAAQRIGIQGVPFFVLNQKYAISGAQPVDVFVDALEKLREEQGIEVFSGENGEACGPEGC